MTLDRWIDFFEVTDGRDKMAKAFQNACRAMAWHLRNTAPGRSVALLAVASKLSEFRSVIKFFKWLKNIRDIRDLTWADDKVGDTVEMFANLGDVFYRGFDNLNWLAQTKVVPYSADRADDLSDFFQFWGYLAQFILVRQLLPRRPPAPSPNPLAIRLTPPTPPHPTPPHPHPIPFRRLSFWLVQDVYQRCRLTPQKFEDTKAYLKEKASLNSDLVADGADLLRVMPTTGYVAFLHKSNFAAQPAFSGWMGLIVGFIGARKVWRKLGKKK